MSLTDQDYQHIHNAIFGTGAIGEPQYHWWQELQSGHVATKDGMVPSYWHERLIAEDPDTETDEDEVTTPRLTVGIWHSTIVKTVTGIVEGKFSDESKLPPRRTAVDPRTVEHCRRLIEDPEYGALEFDHWTSDEVLQVIAYGGIVF